ncbi:MAG TPA: cytochrome c-type biogenesis protein CcmH [Anaerolineae bacterium]|nr:cytochrome c-type biogenesis protein CcmH [Anaerolineae bacterium]
MSRKVFLALLAVVASFYAVAVVEAQQRTPTDDEVNAIAKQLYCPVCPNTPLDVCETKACQDWRQQIRDQLAAGWSEPQIIDYFVAQYGERVLAEPQRGGFTGLVWVLPVISALLGLVVVGQVLKGWRASRQPPLAPGLPAAHISPEVLARIEQELQEMK